MFLGRVFFASYCLISGWISIKIGTNSSQIKLQLPTECFCVEKIGFEIMMHFKEVIFVPFLHCF